MKILSLNGLNILLPTVDTVSVLFTFKNDSMISKYMHELPDIHPNIQDILRYTGTNKHKINRMTLNLNRNLISILRSI